MRDTLDLRFQNTTIQDVNSVFRLLSSPEIVRFTNFKKQNTLHECKAFLAEFLRYNRNEPLQFGPYSIYIKNKMIGLCGIEQKSVESGISEIWYILDQSYWNRGYGMAVVKKLIVMGRANKVLQTIIADAVEDNIASWRLLEKAGFIKIRRTANGFGEEQEYTLLRYELAL